MNLTQTATDRLDELFDDIREIDFVDFPDYANVGDSAIALGLFEYFRRRGVEVASAQSIQTLTNTEKLDSGTVVVNGGGNIGGMYPIADENRLRLVNLLRDGVSVIQAPQTVDFIDEERAASFGSSFRRDNFRIGVRDTPSSEALIAVGVRSILSPDAAHILDLDPVCAPQVPIVALKRVDKESAHGDSSIKSVDWLRDPPAYATSSQLRRSARRAPLLASALNPSPARWESIARRRLRRGLAILSKGETVITDRLHGMILANSIGRRVIAIDNSQAKLSRYLESWGGQMDNVCLVPSWDHALESAGK